MVFFHWLATFFGLIGGVWALFSLLESCASKETKTSVTSWVRSNLPVQVDDKWSSTFVSAFDGLFGPRLLSLRFGLVSSMLSVLCVALLFLIWDMLYPAESSFYFFVNLEDPTFILIIFGGIFIVTNLLTDYLSNCQTRFVLGKLVAALKTNAHRSAFYTYSKWLIADLVLTVSLSAAIVIPVSLYVTDAYVSVMSVIYEGNEGIDRFDLGRMLSLHGTKIPTEFTGQVAKSFNISVYTPPFGIFFYTTVLTSIWLWLYAISGAFVRVLFRVLGPNAIVFRIFDFDHHPLSSLGGVSAILVGIAVIIVSAIYMCYL